jgi:hypothetical protein
VAGRLDARNDTGRPEITATVPKVVARSVSTSRAPATGAALAGSSTIAESVPSKSAAITVVGGWRRSLAARRSREVTGRVKLPSPPVRPPRPLVVVTLVVAVVAAACGDDDGRVTLAYRPPVGTETHYVTEVSSTTISAGLEPCQVADTNDDQTRIDASQRVLDRDDTLARVEVALSREGIGTRTFVVRFDRAAQLTAVESVEGIPAAALGELGLSEIFPAAAGAPPAEPLAPGDRWTIDDEVDLGDAAPTRLRGEGRLVSLGVVDGVDTATVRSSTDLAIRTTTAASTGTRTLDGTQHSDVEAVYDLDTGLLRRAEADTIGTFGLLLGPPPGGEGDPCAGTLTVQLHSEVRLAEPSAD